MRPGNDPLDDFRRALYAGPRATFVERRKQLAGEARSAGDRGTAKLIAEMRKPTAGAHVVNLLANADDNSLDELTELGATIRAAMAGGGDRKMQSLLKDRSAALAKAVAQAHEIADAAGEPVSGAVADQIMQILRTAMASDDGAEAVRTGTLVDAMDEPDFGDFTVGLASPVPVRQSGGRTAPAKASVAVDHPRDDAAARAAEQQRIKSAAAEVERCELAVSAATTRCDSLEEDRTRMAAQLARVENELMAARAELGTSQAQLGEATREFEDASGSARVSPRQ